MYDSEKKLVQPLKLEQPFGALAAERPRYFARQLITPEDMTMEQDYFHNRMRLHNRLLHGCGVVCGAWVEPVQRTIKPVNIGVGIIGPDKIGPGQIELEVEPWKILVNPGYLLGPYGDEIIIPCAQTIDLRQKSAIGTTIETSAQSRDPWCSEAWIELVANEKYYIAVRFKEIAVRPVSVPPLGCGYDESRCEYSRWRDGYEIRVLTEAEYKEIEDTTPQPFEPKAKWNQLFVPPYTQHPACLPSPSHPWVILASVEVDDEGRPDIDNCGPRRLVGALGSFFWQCTKLGLPSVVEATKQEVEKEAPAKPAAVPPKQPPVVQEAKPEKPKVVEAKPPRKRPG